MGRHCCCKTPTDCDLNNCPLCSCIEGIPEEIKLKDFKTAKYKLSGFRDINYSETFGGQGGTGVYVNFSHETQAPADDYRHIPFNGQLDQTYKLKVTGFETLNDREYEFELIDADKVSPPGQCLYKPIKECLIPYGEVEIEETFTYRAIGNVFAEITPIIYECESFSSVLSACGPAYALVRRSKCWFMDNKDWTGDIGYKAVYDLYVQLQVHSAINKEWMTTKKPKCNDGLFENREYPPCEQFEDCEKCDGSGSNNWPTGPIKIILVLKSVTPITDYTGSESKTGLYLKGYSNINEIGEKYFDGLNILKETNCDEQYLFCVSDQITSPCTIYGPCKKTYKYQYGSCKNPFVSNFNFGLNSTGGCEIYGAYEDKSIDVYVTYGRLALSDETIHYINHEFQDEFNQLITKGLVAYEFSNHKNFSFLKQLPFGPIASGKVCNIFDDPNSCIQNISPCPLTLDEMRLPSVTSFCIGYCPNEDHICLTYNAATEELTDEYFAFGNPEGSCASNDEDLNLEICVCDDPDDNTNLDCTDQKLFTDKTKVYGCASLSKEDGPCNVSGISSNLTNNLLEYLFRSDRYKENGDEDETTCDEEGNELDFLDPEQKYDERIYTFTASDGIDFASRNLIRHAIFGIEQQIEWSIDDELFLLRGPKPSCNFDQFWYSGVSPCDPIRIVGERHFCLKCPCATLVPIGGGGTVDCASCNSQPKPICLCNGEDVKIDNKPLKPTIPVFESTWRQIPEEILPFPPGAIERVYSVRNYVSSSECLTGKAFIVPKPWNLRIKATFK